MKNKFRLIIVLVTIIALLLSLFFFIQLVDLLFSIQAKYADAPLWLVLLYIVGIATISFFGLALLYRVIKFGRKKPERKVKIREIHDDQSFQQKLTKLENIGAEYQHITQDFDALLEIRKDECVTIALFGEINTGKSSLIQTLTGQELDISAKGGETKWIESYSFTDHDRAYQLFDMPGIHEIDQQEELVYQKAIKSHVVVLVVSGDISRSVYQSYEKLLAYKKPVIIAINKADFYNMEEKEVILNKFMEMFVEVPVVWVSSTHQQLVEKHLPDNSIEVVSQTVLGQVSDLIQAIEGIALDRLALDHQLNHSYFHLLEDKIDQSLSKTRKEKSNAIIKQYSYKATFTGMAAVGPGSDILLQGYLGVGMAKALSRLYEVDLKSIDFDSMMGLLGSKMKRELTVVLALVGNVFKAFPGVGTVAGGAIHAVAYGLIFEAVGRAMVICLEEDHTLDQAHILSALEGQLGENLEKRARNLVKAFIQSKK